MKKILSLLLVILMMTMCVVPVLAEDDDDVEYYDQDVQLKNSTGMDIVAIYISPTEEENWGDNCMDGTMEDEWTLDVTFNVIASDGYTWDLRAETAGGNEMTFYGLDLSSAVAIELICDDDGETDYAVYDERFE